MESGRGPREVRMAVLKIVCQAPAKGPRSSQRQYDRADAGIQPLRRRDASCYVLTSFGAT